MPENASNCQGGVRRGSNVTKKLNYAPLKVKK